MATPQGDLNLVDIYTTNKNDVLTGCVEGITTYAPEWSQIPVMVRAGIDYTTLIRMALPTAGFRVINQGILGSKSTYKQIKHEMFPLDVQLEVDELAYEASDGSAGDLLFLEGQGALQQTIIVLGAQTWYGQPQDGSNGFVGLRYQLLSNLQNNPGNSPVTASANTTSSTAYGLWLHPQGVSYNVGRFGEIAFPPFVRQKVGGGSGNPGYFAWVSNIRAWIGLSVSDPESVFGITGVTKAAPLTDNLGADLIATVPMNRRSGFTFFMNRLVHTSLQKSRSSITYQPAGAKSGTPAFSPPPLDIDGFPLVVTDSITNTENNS
jgi:hypothetical protein